jgi:hypothetical protein
MMLMTKVRGEADPGVTKRTMTAREHDIETRTTILMRGRGGGGKSGKR